MGFKLMKIITVFLMVLLIVAPEAYSSDVLIPVNEKDLQDGKLQIVASFSSYASIAEYLTQDKAEVRFISKGDQDPHFVPPKPSYAMMLKNADMWITTGLDLEIWSTTILDKARNRKIMDGEIGFVSASDGANLLQKAEKVSRAEGDVHPMGNPHIQMGPVNWIVIASNITIGLKKVDPANSEYYETRRQKFTDEVYKRIFGEELLEIFDGPTLAKLLENKTLFTFLERKYKGEALSVKLGGWLKQALPIRGKKVIAYHKNWVYFTESFGLEVLGHIEPKPGIPPSAKHVQYIVNLIKEQNVSIMLVANYFERKSPRSIEAKTGIKAVFLPMTVYGIPEITDIFELMDYWIKTLIDNI